MTSRSRRKHRTTARITAVRIAFSHASTSEPRLGIGGKLKAAFVASLGLLLAIGTSPLSAQIGSGVATNGTQYSATAGPQYSGSAGPQFSGRADQGYSQPTASRTNAGRSQRSAGRGSLSTVLLGTRNTSQASADGQAQKEHAQQAYAQPQYAQPQYAQPQYAQHPSQQQPTGYAQPVAPPTPAQVYSQAYAYAVKAGYPVANAQAYAQQMVQQFQARQVAGQQAQMAMAAGQQPAAVHTSMMHQHLEQQRVQQEHAMAAAQQNAKLYQALQGQRAQMYQNAVAQQQSQYASQQQAEMQSVRAASLQVAQQLAARSNAVLNQGNQPIPAADSLTAQVLPSQYSQAANQSKSNQSKSNQTAANQTALALESEELNLEDAISELGQPVPEDVQWEMPTEIQQLPSEDPNPLRRTPRRLPNVEPEPMPKRQQSNGSQELKLEGYSSAEQHNHVRPVNYQQPVAQSFGAQGYAPQMAIGEDLNAQTPEFYEQQLQVAPPQMTYAEPSKTFSVEAEIQEELPLNDPLFQDANTNWDSEYQPSVKPPTGIRAQTISTRLDPTRRRSDSGYPMARSYQDQDANDLEELNLGGSKNDQDEMSKEDLPEPRDYNDDEISKDSIVKSCDQMRQEMLSHSIRSISLDLSTPLNSVVADDESDEEKVRDWKDPNGNVIARGKAISATRYGVNIIDEAGLARTLSLSTLSGTDQKHAWDLMDLPFECDLVATNVLNHNFTPTTVTWYASALCHKPLYFEDIQLERYGHTKGPIRQPVRSAARFLGQAFLLPYQVGIHPPNECQYSLGLYRPGSCAPYLRTPFPWERRAVGYQAAALAGVFLLIP